VFSISREGFLLCLWNLATTCLSSSSFLLVSSSSS
jgi:hypothetical protein